MLVCVYRTLTTYYSSDVLINNINIMVIYSIYRDTYIQGDARQMILDILIWIKSNIDRTLSFRSSCCEGVCGSCAMLINNTNTLACIQPVWLINSYVTVYPLPHFNIVRDLVVDLKHFYEQYCYINPFYSLYDSSGFADYKYSKFTLLYLYLSSLLIPYIYIYNNNYNIFNKDNFTYLYINFVIFIYYYINLIDMCIGYDFLKNTIIYLKV